MYGQETGKKPPATALPDDDRQVGLDEWDDIVADRFKVPKSLMKAVRSQESGGNVNAVSPTGVRGRYQVTEATAKQYGLDRNDPFQQSVAAAKHLRAMYDATPGDDDDTRWLGSVAKYYGGNNAVQGDQISGSSVDGVSNPARHVEGVARKWGELRKSERQQPIPSTIAVGHSQQYKPLAQRPQPRTPSTTTPNVFNKNVAAERQKAFVEARQALDFDNVNPMAEMGRINARVPVDPKLRAQAEAYANKSLPGQVAEDVYYGIARGGEQLQQAGQRVIGAALGGVRASAGGPLKPVDIRPNQARLAQEATRQRLEEQQRTSGNPITGEIAAALPIAAGGILAATAGGLPALAGYNVALEDWQDPTRSAVRAGLNTVVPVAGAKIGARVAAPLINRIGSQAGQTAARVGTEVVSGGATNIAQTAGEQQYFDGRIDRDALIRSGIVGGAVSGGTAIAPQSAPQRRTAAPVLEARQGIDQRSAANAQVVARMADAPTAPAPDAPPTTPVPQTPAAVPGAPRREDFPPGWEGNMKFRAAQIDFQRSGAAKAAKAPKPQMAANDLRAQVDALKIEAQEAEGAGNPASAAAKYEAAQNQLGQLRAQAKAGGDAQLYSAISEEMAINKANWQAAGRAARSGKPAPVKQAVPPAEPLPPQEQQQGEKRRAPGMVNPKFAEQSRIIGQEREARQQQAGANAPTRDLTAPLSAGEAKTPQAVEEITRTTAEIPRVRRDKIPNDIAPVQGAPISEVKMQNTSELPPFPKLTPPTNRITEGAGNELPRRVSQPLEGQPIEPPTRYTEYEGGELQRYSRPLEGQPAEVPQRAAAVRAAPDLPQTAIRDSEDRPLLMYHGTSSQEGFNLPRGKSWFTSDPEYGSQYAEGAHLGGAEGPSRVYPAYLDIRNPYQVADRLSQIEVVNDPDRLTSLQAQGYDGITRIDEDGKVIAFPFSRQSIHPAYSPKTETEQLPTGQFPAVKNLSEKQATYTPEEAAVREREQLPPVERRRALREAAPIGEFGKLSEFSRRRAPAGQSLSGSDELRKLLDLPPMPEYRDAEEGKTTAWGKAAQETMDALAEAAGHGKERSSQMGLEGLRDAWATVQKRGKERGTPISDDLRKRFVDTATDYKVGFLEPYMRLHETNSTVDAALAEIDQTYEDGKTLTTEQSRRLYRTLRDEFVREGITEHYFRKTYWPAVKQAGSENRGNPTRTGEARSRSDVPARATGTDGRVIERAAVSEVAKAPEAPKAPTTESRPAEAPKPAETPATEAPPLPLFAAFEQKAVSRSDLDATLRRMKIQPAQRTALLDSRKATRFRYKVPSSRKGQAEREGLSYSLADANAIIEEAYQSLHGQEALNQAREVRRGQDQTILDSRVEKSPEYKALQGYDSVSEQQKSRFKQLATDAGWPKERIQQVVDDHAARWQDTVQDDGELDFYREELAKAQAKRKVATDTALQNLLDKRILDTQAKIDEILQARQSSEPAEPAKPKPATVPQAPDVAKGQDAVLSKDQWGQVRHAPNTGLYSVTTFDDVGATREGYSMGRSQARGKGKRTVNKTFESEAAAQTYLDRLYARELKAGRIPAAPERLNIPEWTDKDGQSRAALGEVEVWPQTATEKKDGFRSFRYPDGRPGGYIEEAWYQAAKQGNPQAPDVTRDPGANRKAGTAAAVPPTEPVTPGKTPLSTIKNIIRRAREREAAKGDREEVAELRRMRVDDNPFAQSLRTMNEAELAAEIAEMGGDPAKLRNNKELMVRWLTREIGRKAVAGEYGKTPDVSAKKAEFEELQRKPSPEQLRASALDKLKLSEDDAISLMDTLAESEKNAANPYLSAEERAKYNQAWDQFFDAELTDAEANRLKGLYQQSRKPKFVSEAEARLNEYFSGKRAGSGVEQLVDTTIVAGYKAYKAGVKFRDWAKTVLDEVGEKARPYLQKVWRDLKANKPEQQTRAALGKQMAREALLRAKAANMTADEAATLLRQMGAEAPKDADPARFAVSLASALEKLGTNNVAEARNKVQKFMTPMAFGDAAQKFREVAKAGRELRASGLTADEVWTLRDAVPLDQSRAAALTNRTPEQRSAAGQKAAQTRAANVATRQEQTRSAIAGVREARAQAEATGVAQVKSKAAKEPWQMTAKEYKQFNPHTGGALTGNAQAFDRLPDDAIVTVFHATSPENAAILADKKQGTPSLQGQGIQGISSALYVGADPVSVSGYGKEMLALTVRKSQLKKSPEARRKESVGAALVDASAGAIIEGAPLSVQRVPRRDIRGHEALIQQAIAEGKPVPPEVLADYPDLKPPVKEDLAARIARLDPTLTRAEIEAYRNQQQKPATARQADKPEMGEDAALARLKRLQAAAAKVPSFVAEQQRILDEYKSGKRSGSGGEQLFAQAVVTGHKLYRAGMEFAQWSKAVIQEAGEAVRPHLRRAWEKVRDAQSFGELPKTRADVENSPAFKRWFRGSKVADGEGKPILVYHGTQSPTEITALDYSKLDPNALYGPGFYTTQDYNVAGDENGYANTKRTRGASHEEGHPHVYPLYLNIKNPFRIDGVIPPDAVRKLLGDVPEHFNPTGESVYDELVKQHGSKANANLLLQAAGFDGITHLGGGGAGSVHSRRFDSLEEAQAYARFRGGDAVAVVPKYDRSLKARQIIDDEVDAPHYAAPNHRVWIAFHPEQIKSYTGNRGTFDANNPSILMADPFGAGATLFGGKKILDNLRAGRRKLPPKEIPKDFKTADWITAQMENMAKRTLSNADKAKLADPKLPEADRLRILANAKITPEQEAGFERAADDAFNALQANDFDGFQDAAQRMKFITDAPATNWQKASAIRKAAMLSRPVSHLRNLLGNTAFQNLEEGARVPGSIGDILLGTVTGRRTLEGASVEKSARAIYAAATDGWQAAKDAMAGRNNEDFMKALQVKEVHFNTPFVDKAVKKVFRLLGAEDQIFYTGAYDRAIREAASLTARNEAKQGIIARKDMEAREKALLAAPTAQMEVDAALAANVAVFRNDNALSDAIGKMRDNLSDRANFALDLVMPFDRTPTNVILRALEYSPLGLARGAVKGVAGSARAIGAKRAAKKAGTPSKADVQAAIDEAFTPQQQRSAAQLLGRGTVGTGLLALGYVLASKGLMTGFYDEDDWRGEAVKRAAGAQPLAIQIGGRWYELSGIGPIGMAFGMGATMHDESKKKNGDIYGGAAKAAVQTIMEMPALESVKTMGKNISLISKDRANAGKAIGNIVGSFVPGIINDVGQVIPGVRDPFEREVKDNPKKVKGLRRALREGGGQVAARIPGVRRMLPVKKDITGKPVESRPLAPIDPFNSQRAVRPLPKR